jgi:hypothetical protein
LIIISPIISIVDLSIMITARRKSTVWSALEKPVAPLNRVRRLPENTFTGAGEGI